MALSAEDDNMTKIKTILAALEDKVSDHEKLSTFTQIFMTQNSQHVSDWDASGFNSQLILEAFEYLQNRPANAHKIRAYDLNIQSNGTRLLSKITVIEISNDDMPFLVDSIMGELQERQLEIYNILHPILSVTRDSTGNLTALFENKPNAQDDPQNQASHTRESFIQIQLEPLADEIKRNLVKSLSEILESVRLAVADWPTMRARVSEAVARYTQNPPNSEKIDVSESVEFLNWLLDDHFLFLGIREYKLISTNTDNDLVPIDDSALGILRDNDIRILRRRDQEIHLPEEVRPFFFSHDPLIITKANARSIVHRRVHMDYVGIKTFNSEGDIIGEVRIVGLFTSIAYTQLPRNIPFLRHKVNTVIRRYGRSPKSHSAKALINVLDTFPRDELFQVSTDRLYEIAVGIHELDIQPRPRVFTRVDEFQRFISVLVYVPRDNYATRARRTIADYLAKTLKGHISAFTPFFTEGPFVRIHFIIGRDFEEIPEYTDAELEKHITDIVRSWPDKLKDALASQYDYADASRLFSKYCSAFPVGYEALTTINHTLNDIARIETLNQNNPIAINFYCTAETEVNQCRVSIYHLNGPIPLSKRVPILENFGFAVIDERSFKIKRPASENGDGQNEAINLHDMVLVAKGESSFSLATHNERLEQAFLAAWYNKAENDPFNQLIIRVGTDWRQVAAMRALAAYLRQLGIPFTKRYVSETLSKHANITNTLLKLFCVRTDPEYALALEERQKQAAELIHKLENDLAHIPSLDEDRILRYYSNMIMAVLRTNFYQGKTSGPEARPETISFKFDSAQIEAMPEPKPFAEIFVYSPRVEGIHLRGGKIARGGLRWSDRRQDFRTEVLGLAKAQQVKNTVIVPTGAKGGFFPKELPSDGTREQVFEEGIACYKLFISSLLSLTDNLDGQTIHPPKDIIRHDDDDPYLVVAADKGTATFSDYANEISQKFNFWMDDAFASGGSAGYDHKKMGITARGAWESVKRHFREMDKDIQSETFQVIGIGDMSGDVFGNGMLLSRAIQLTAAFDHRDIFIDPTPDPETSWNERKRLFDMGRSSWQDYDTSLISAGGGIFSRQAKSIELSNEIQNLTGLQEKNVTPNELINALLKSEMDLLWFGGIGTYVRADNERDEDVGDRANDQIRITASDLKAKVVGEGANLGMTQEARIQFALARGKVNSDAIDNSAGVNSSDLEVNIKIALGSAMKASRLNREERNDFLVKMTEEVAAACLRNNYLQTLTISLGERRGLADMSYQQRLMRELEADELLDRAIEFLPTDAELSERYQQSQPLTRPELAVLLAYAKIDLFNKLIKSSIPDDSFLEQALINYFPKTLYDSFPNDIKTHQLRREIIATQLTNAIINRGGSTMSIRLKEETGHNVESISYAFIAASEIFDVERIYDEIDELDNKISGTLQLELYSTVQTLLRRQTIWMLRNLDLTESLSEILSTYKNGLQEFDKISASAIDPNLAEGLSKKKLAYEEGGVPAPLAEHIVDLTRLSHGPDVVLTAHEVGADITKTTHVYGQVGLYFKIFELRNRASDLHAEDHFDRIALNSALGDLSESQRIITEYILQNDTTQDNSFQIWLEQKKHLAQRTKNVLREILDHGPLTISKLAVAVSQLRDLSH